MKNINDYIYILVFKNKEAKTIARIPLSNEVSKDLEIPTDSLWIELRVNRLVENNQYERYTLYNLIVKDILDNKFNKGKNNYYITTSRFKYYPGFSEKNLIIFNTPEELQKYIKTLISFFHENPYGQYNIEEKQETEEKKNNSSFSRKLTNILNKKNIKI